MKNVQDIDGALNSVFDVFQATDEEFSMMFPQGEDVAFVDEVYGRGEKSALDSVFGKIWARRIPKREALGIHGILFVGLEHKKAYYPTRRDEKAVNPDGSQLRA